jgi:ABC-type oligopeptide transport system substrate-binding subunit
MKNFTRILSLLLVLAMVAVAAVSCVEPNDPGTTTAANTEDGTTTPDATETDAETTPAEYTGYISELKDGKYARGDDEAVYNNALAKFEELRQAANNETDPDKRFVLYAQAEAELLDSAVMIPTTTQGGAYTISRVAPRTIAYVQWGNDDDRFKGMVISDEFLTPAERNELLDQWAKAREGEGTYDPAAYLQSKGHTIKTEYALTFTTAPVTLDWLNTSSQADTEITVNTVDGLVEYDNFGIMQPALAESWTISEDKLTYTFKIRQGVSWYTAEGAKFADVTANDFEAGFHHMLDAAAGLEWLVDGVVTGVHDYITNGGSWDNVGYKATDDYTLVVTLERPTSYFLTMLTYSCFLPISKPFYESKGGVFGIEEYKAASEDSEKYTFGKATDIASQVYCGPFLLKKLDAESEIIVEKNPNYYKLDQVKLERVRWILFGDSSSYEQLYKDVVAGIYAGIGLTKSTGIYDLAVADGNKDKYAYISDTNSTSYFAGLNLNRGTFALDSGAMTSTKTEQEKADTVTALANRHFRQAIAYAFDQTTWNGVSRGEDLANQNLRSMYTMPVFVQLSADATDADGHTFKGGTFYGDLVQYYLEKMGSPIKVADGQNGWYNADAAKAALAKAKEELGDKVTWPIKLDVPYQDSDDASTAQVESFKQIIEGVLGAENVVINKLGGEKNDYYASGYRASNGEAGNFDIFYGSGWGPDYGDPSTYLDTFAPLGNGYMTKVVGLF